MQAKLKPVKQKLIAVLTVLVLLATVFSYFSFPAFSSADAATTEPYQKEELEISNGEFDQTSGSAPFDASNWTAEALGGTSEGATVNGIVDLSPESINSEDALKDFGLDIYEEFTYGAFPKTPFGKANSNFTDSDANALMINSKGSKVAYGYKSSTVSLSSNSYYKISAWVKTCDFGNIANNESGASILVDGLKNPLMFKNIDTTAFYGDSSASEDKDRNFGWVEYSFYIETSTMVDSSVTVSLQLGDAYTHTDRYGKTHEELHTASGYVFFDHVTAFRLSPDEFNTNVANIGNTENFSYPDSENRTYSVRDDGTAMYYSENDAEYLCIDDNGNIVGSDYAGYDAKEIGSFDNGGKGWSTAAESSGNFHYNVFDSLYEDTLGIENDIPFSPNGSGDRIALVSSFNPDRNEQFVPQNAGIVTDYFTVNRYRNYRLSVWVKTENGAVASAAIEGYDYRGGVITPGVNEGKPQLRAVTDLTEGDSTNTSRNGWREVAFYIKGSSFADYNIRLELRLGRATLGDNGTITTEDAAGVAMFDNVRIEELTSREYTDYSGGGTSVTFDPTATSNSISNNEFNNIEEYGEYGELYTPSNWTLLGAGEDGTTGMSTNQVNADYKDYVFGGVISSDATSYKYKRTDEEDYKEYGVATHKQSGADGIPSNLLMIKSDESTGLSAEKREKGGVAVGYRSSSFSISSESVQRVDVSMLADDISGYGANLVLKNSSGVIASIEKIKTTGNAYKTYSFYVQTGSSDLSEVYLEIWLGLYDKNNNTDKLAYGTLFVENVSLTNMSASTNSEDANATQQALESARRIYSSRAADYRAKGAGSDTDFAVYSSLTEDFSAFDYYDADYIRAPYNWAVNSVQSYDGNDALKYGIFDATGGQVPQGYKHNADNRYTMLVQNVSPASSRIRSSINYVLASGSYYTITVVAKVDIPTAQKSERPDYKGAYIGLADSEFYIEDVKTTATVTDIYNPDSDVQGEYKTFTFYVHTAGELATEDDTDTSNTSDTIVTMEFGIGGSDSNAEWAIGSMYVNSITVNQSSNIDFVEARDALETGGALIGKYSVIADYSDDDEEEEEEEDNDTGNITGDNWYVYTTVILAVVLIVVLIAVAVRYYGIKRKRDSASTDAPTYDRERTLVRQHNKRAEDDGAITSKSLDSYDAFDEFEEDRIEEEQLMKLEAEELSMLEASEAEAAKVKAEEAEASEAEQSPAPESAETTEAETESADEVKSEVTEEPTSEERDEDYTYSDEIVDFTPSEEKKRELAERQAAEERAKAEKEAAAKKAAEERAKAEAERKAANRRYNNWDSFDD